MSCEKKKRRRRTAAQIDRKYVCSYAGCKKAYGSEGSLTQHMRLKHRSLTLSHRDRGSPPPLDATLTYPSDLNTLDLFHGMEKLRMRSNSMPSDGCIQHCDTPRWPRKKSTMVTPHSARASKSKSLKGAAHLPAATAVLMYACAVGKTKRSQSMSSPPETPERGVFTTPRGFVPAVEVLHLSPHCTYLPQSAEPYRGKECMSMLNSLDWEGTGNTKDEADMSSNNNAATDLSVLQSLVDDCAKNDVMMSMSPEDSAPTSPPLYAEFPLDDDMMENNQHDNDIYYKNCPTSSSSTSSTSSGWTNDDMDLVSSTFLHDPNAMPLVRHVRHIVWHDGCL
ncbi:hypothetical protein DYB32_004093 [Aphanomyces invadans]|uniref:C2H2-type domain-containing protein n=1 Tax=Aphanomyces invadans TaxID=157072 RepID=A0A418AYI1_9STRA|nr:hypothetical protein DYB32_004093 [Aphanomyces invadans]